jgi:hypothetical protein
VNRIRPISVTQLCAGSYSSISREGGRTTEDLS